MASKRGLTQWDDSAHEKKPRSGAKVTLLRRVSMRNRPPKKGQTQKAVGDAQSGVISCHTKGRTSRKA